ncbi:MAG: hypothetical protein JSV42_18620 [Chloroflexota bacterium]|nr:MAG: hypothetical protein JSV42_18620 [Chloroflexota bacterium]
MNVGMLWFDNDVKSDLIVKIERAAAYYLGKYGDKPNICFVHPSMAQIESKEQVLRAGDIEIKLTKSVLPHHLWIGIQSLNGNSIR